MKRNEKIKRNEKNMKTPGTMKEIKEHGINKARNTRNNRKQNQRENMSKCESLKTDFWNHILKHGNTGLRGP